MTCDAALVNKANRMLTSTQASTAYTDYNAIAKAILDHDDPGLSVALYDWCHAKMICHLYETGDPTTSLKSFTTGDFSGSRDVGTTVFLTDYQQIIGSFQSDTTYTETAVRRSDAVMPEMQFDQAEVPTYYTEV